MKTLCKIVMLPATRAEKCVMLDFRRFMFWMNDHLTKSYVEHSGYSARHLYFVSDVKPIIGDYAITGFGNIKEVVLVTSDSGVSNGFCKVIATTDISIPLPRPSLSSIKTLIDAFNLGNEIKDVFIDFDASIPILNQDGTVDISLMQKHFTRQEVISKLYQLLEATGSEIHAEMKGINTPIRHIEYSGSDIELWISKNL